MSTYVVTPENVDALRGEILNFTKSVREVAASTSSKKITVHKTWSTQISSVKITNCATIARRLYIDRNVCQNGDSK